MRVMPPPLPVPRLTVTNSRNTLRSPITSSVRSPANFLSCGSPPTATWPMKRFSRPMRVGPLKLQCGPIWQPSPISTSGPTTVKAPTLTPAPRRAAGSITAVGWIRALSFIGSGLCLLAGAGAQHFGTGDHFPVDLGFAVVHGHVADHALDAHVQLQHVAGHHLLAEAGVVDLDHVEQLGLRVAAHRQL